MDAQLSPLMEDVLQNGGEVVFQVSGWVTARDNEYKKEYPVLPSQVVGVVKGFCGMLQGVKCLILSPSALFK